MFINVVLLISFKDSPADFIGISHRRVELAPYQRRSCVRVLIRQDDVLEQNERFSIILNVGVPSHLNDRISVHNTLGTINIIDDNGEGKALIMRNTF